MDLKSMLKGISEYYDIFYTHENDVTFYLDQVKKFGGPVLELGCGTGRVLIPIAREGYSITGLDISRNMLNVLLRKIKKEKFAKNIEIIESDIASFYFTKRFRLAIMPYRPFQHLLTRKEQERCLRNIHKHLETSGVLVMDIFNPNIKPDKIFNHKEVFNDEKGDIITKTISSYRDKERQRVKAELTIEKTNMSGQVERKKLDFEMSYLFKDQLQELLEKNGFKVLNIYGDFDYSEFREDSREIIVVAKKI